MKRYLVFDSSCSTCTEIAHKVCKEAGDWIHDVVSLRDSRAKQWLKAAGIDSLSSPAIIELNGEGIKVIRGMSFRWRLLTILGPARAFKLAKVVSGDLMAAMQPANDQRTHETGQDQGLAQSKLSRRLGRRSFLGAASRLAAGLMVITGIGFSGSARPAAKPGGSGKASVSMFYSPWLVNLAIASESRMLQGSERESAWRRFVSTPNIERLLSSADFDAWVGAQAFRSAVLSGAVPESGEQLAARNIKETEHGLPVPLWVCSEQMVVGGGVLSTGALGVGNATLVAVELKEGSDYRQSELRLYWLDREAEKIQYLAALRQGAFIFKRRTLFTTMSTPSPGIVGNGITGE
jgi:hypothetical protein